MERGIQCCASLRMYVVLLREVDRSIELSDKSSTRWNTRDNTNVDACVYPPYQVKAQNYFDSKRNCRPEDRYLKCQLDPKPATRKGKKASLSQWSQGVAAERQHCQLQTGKIILMHCDHESLLITVMPAESRG